MAGILQHPWDVTIQRARQIQGQLSGLVLLEPPPGEIRLVAGADVHIRSGIATAAVVVLAYPELRIQSWAIARRQVSFPYVSGLLSFREGPAILEAFERLPVQPELIILDGQGLAHPRRFGLACHLGVCLDLPTIGCAKSRLCGACQDPDPTKGSYSLLVDSGETIGASLRTRTLVKPVFVSPGHRMDLRNSIRHVLACCTRFRLPETTRIADQLSRSLE